MTALKNPTNQLSKSISDKAQTESTLKIAIIGGGLTGLFTAEKLEEALSALNIEYGITIFEKSAGVGRLATRYKTNINSQDEHYKTNSVNSSLLDKKNPKDKKNLEDKNNLWQFDFGAPFFTAKTKAFQDYLQRWCEQGVIKPWKAQTARYNNNEPVFEPSINLPSIILPLITLEDKWNDVTEPRFISVPKMTTWGRQIASKLNNTTVKYKTRVAPLAQHAHKAGKTTLCDDTGINLGKFDWVICTAPQGQAVELFANTGLNEFSNSDVLLAQNMLACYSLMLGWESTGKLPPTLRPSSDGTQWDVLYIEDTSSKGGLHKSATEANKPLNNRLIDRVIVEHHKPGRDMLLPSVTIQADNKWAQTHVDDDIESVCACLIRATKAILGFDESTYPTHVDWHRWRYASTQALSERKLAKNFHPFVNSAKQWIIIGDWCIEGRIESCYQAADEAVKLIVEN